MTLNLCLIWVDMRTGEKVNFGQKKLRMDRSAVQLGSKGRIVQGTHRSRTNVRGHITVPLY
jgi:hypothetical protein